MLFNVRVPLVIRPKVTLTGDTSRGLEVPREHTTRCTPNLAGYVLSRLYYRFYACQKRGVAYPRCPILGETRRCYSMFVYNW